MWIQNNPDYATINTRKVHGITLILNYTFKNTEKTKRKGTFFSLHKTNFLNKFSVWIFRDKVEKLNFGSSFMSKDLHSQAGSHHRVHTEWPLPLPGVQFIICTLWFTLKQ
jgi:hypothetical protein